MTGPKCCGNTSDSPVEPDIKEPTLYRNSTRTINALHRFKNKNFVQQQRVTKVMLPHVDEFGKYIVKVWFFE